MTKDAIILLLRQYYIECLSYYAFLDHAATYNHCENVPGRQSTPRRVHTIHSPRQVIYQLLHEKLSCTSPSSEDLAASCLNLPRAMTS